MRLASELSRGFTLSLCYLSHALTLSACQTQQSIQKNGDSAQFQSSNIQHKLDKQFERFDRTKEWFKNQDLSTRRISRVEWDAQMQSDEPGADEIELLKQHFTVEIRTAKTEAMRNSLVDLDRIRNDASQVRAFCQAVPKGALLHLHPSGTLDHETIRTIMMQGGIFHKSQFLDPFVNSGNHEYVERIKRIKLADNFMFQKLSPKQQEEIISLFFIPQRPSDFSVHFQPIFSLVDTILNNEMPKFAMMFHDFIDEISAAHVSLVEFSWGMYQESNPDVNAMLYEAIEYGKNKGVHVLFKRAFSRKKSTEKLHTEADYFLDHARFPGLISGVDLLALETGEDALDKGQYIYHRVINYNDQHPEQKLGVTMHAGEMGNLQNPRDAVLMGVEHLGHGVAVWKDPILVEYLRKQKHPQVTIDANIWSNYLLSVVNPMESHPFLNLLRLGIPITLSTDDPGIFQSDTNTECEIVIQHSDITYAEWKAIAKNSLTTSYADDTVKKQLVRKLDEDFRRFESELPAYSR